MIAKFAPDKRSWTTQKGEASKNVTFIFWTESCIRAKVPNAPPANERTDIPPCHVAVHKAAMTIKVAPYSRTTM